MDIDKIKFEIREIAHELKNNPYLRDTIYQTLWDRKVELKFTLKTLLKEAYENELSI